MIFKPKIGQKVKLHYRASLNHPLQNEHGEIIAISRGPGPQNVLVLVNGEKIVVPKGNLVDIDYQTKQKKKNTQTQKKKNTQTNLNFSGNAMRYDCCEGCESAKFGDGPCQFTKQPPIASVLTMSGQCKWYKSWP